MCQLSCCSRRHIPEVFVVNSACCLLRSLSFAETQIHPMAEALQHLPGGTPGALLTVELRLEALSKPQKFQHLPGGTLGALLTAELRLEALAKPQKSSSIWSISRNRLGSGIQGLTGSPDGWREIKCLCSTPEVKSEERLRGVQMEAKSSRTNRQSLTVLQPSCS